MNTITMPISVEASIFFDDDLPALMTFDDRIPDRIGLVVDAPGRRLTIDTSMTLLLTALQRGRGEAPAQVTFDDDVCVDRLQVIIEDGALQVTTLAGSVRLVCTAADAAAISGHIAARLRS